MINNISVKFYSDFVEVIVRCSMDCCKFNCEGKCNCYQPEIYIEKYGEDRWVNGTYDPRSAIKPRTKCKSFIDIEQQPRYNFGSCRKTYERHIVYLD